MTLDAYVRAILDYMAALDAVLFHGVRVGQYGLVSRSESFSVTQRLACLCVVHHRGATLAERHDTAARLGLQLRHAEHFDCLEPRRWPGQ